MRSLASTICPGITTLTAILLIGCSDPMKSPKDVSESFLRAVCRGDVDAAERLVLPHQEFMGGELQIFRFAARKGCGDITFLGSDQEFVWFYSSDWLIRPESRAWQPLKVVVGVKVVPMLDGTYRVDKIQDYTIFSGGDIYSKVHAIDLHVGSIVGPEVVTIMRSKGLLHTDPDRVGTDERPDSSSTATRSSILTRIFEAVRSPWASSPGDSATQHTINGADGLNSILIEAARLDPTIFGTDMSCEPQQDFWKEVERTDLLNTLQRTTEVVKHEVSPTYTVWLFQLGSCWGGAGNIAHYMAVRENGDFKGVGVVHGAIEDLRIKGNALRFTAVTRAGAESEYRRACVYDGIRLSGCVQ